MKKFIITILLFASGWLIFNLYQKKKTPDLGAEYRYAIADPDRVAKIQINYRLIDPDILLERKKGYWLLNGKYRTRADAMENLLSAISTIELQYIPTPAAKENMIRNLATTGTKVELLDAQNQVIKSYFIGGNTPDDRGTFMIMNGSQSPSVVTLSGFEGSLRPYFIMPEIEWRDRTVFAENYDKLEEVIVEYNNEPSSSFALRKSEDGFSVFSTNDRLDVANRAIKRGSVEAYLQNYKKIGAEAIIDDANLWQKLTNQSPFARITLRRSDHSEYQTTFYPLELEDTENRNQPIERYHIIDNEGNIFLVQHRLFGQLFVDINNFFND